MPIDDQLKKVITEEKVREHKQTLSILDALRRSRKSRGGVGAPLEVPPSLRSAARGEGIIITDADLRPDTPMPESFRRNTAAGGKDVKVEE